jgi:carbonic anhydrase/acetyltransferase-like protein (isoleucine patch superfamily)
MSDGGSLRQSIGALDGNLGRDVRLDGSVGLHGCEVGDETVQTEAQRGLRNTRIESRACIAAGAAFPGGGTVKEGV